MMRYLHTELESDPRSFYEVCDSWFDVDGWSARTRSRFSISRKPKAPRMCSNCGAAGIGGGSYLGVNLAEIDADRARELKLNQTYGVEITRVVEEGSPAEKAGIESRGRRARIQRTARGRHGAVWHGWSARLPRDARRNC